MSPGGGAGTRLLVAGLPRSETTWVGEVLGRTANTRYLHEPDNHLVRPEAWWARPELGPYPEIAPGQADVGDYERLWALAFAGGAGRSPLYAGARLLHRAGASGLGGRIALRPRRLGPGVTGANLVVKSVRRAGGRQDQSGMSRAVLRW